MTSQADTAKQRFLALAPQTPGLPLFHQPWWLDAVCGPDCWGVAVRESGKQLQAAMPYRIENRIGMTFLTMPPLTQFLGPWLAPSEGKLTRRMAREKELLGELIDQLPRFHYYNQNFSSDIGNWLPFYWRGFQQSTYYSYVLDDLADTDALWAGLQENIRREIRKARKRVSVRDDGSLDELHVLIDATYRRQHLAAPVPGAVLQRLWNACRDHQCARIVLAEGGAGELHAGALVVWDAESAFYLIGGGDPRYRTSGAASLVLWEAIRAVSEQTRRFDFEGSMVESIERFFRAFGARRRAYFNVRKMSAGAWLAVHGRRQVRRNLARIARRGSE